MLIRPAFITNSSSSAYLMFGVSLTNAERKEVLKKVWFDCLTDEQRWEIFEEIELGSLNIHDPDHWEEILDELEDAYSYFYELHEAMLSDTLGLELYSDDDYFSYHDECLLYTSGSWNSVEAGQIKRLPMYAEGMVSEWHRILSDIVTPAGVDKSPAWHIVGKWPGA